MNEKPRLRSPVDAPFGQTDGKGIARYDLLAGGPK